MPPKRFRAWKHLRLVPGDLLPPIPRKGRRAALQKPIQDPPRFGAAGINVVATDAGDRYQAQTSYRGVRTYLGRFKTPQEAKKAIRAAQAAVRAAEKA